MAMSINGTSGVTFPDASVQTTAPILPPGTILNTQTFSASGTWTKPATGRLVYIRLWSGGSGGSKGTSGPNDPQGGRGGDFFCTTLLMSDMPSTVPVTVGAGGLGRTAADFTQLPGAPSYFGTRSAITTMVVNSDYVIADYAGSTAAQWGAVTRVANLPLNGNPGLLFNCRAVGVGSGQIANPLVYAQAGGSYYGQFTKSSTINIYERFTESYFNGGGSVSNNAEQFCGNPNAYFTTSSTSSSLVGSDTYFGSGPAVFAGGGGGSLHTTYNINSPIAPPQRSLYGGNGGAAGAGAVSGTNGTAPGGGGGATNTGAKAGDGAAGRVEVYVLA